MIELIIIHELEKHQINWDNFFNLSLPSREENPVRVEIELPKINIPRRARGKRAHVLTSEPGKQR